MQVEKPWCQTRLLVETTAPQSYACAEEVPLRYTLSELRQCSYYAVDYQPVSHCHIAFSPGTGFLGHQGHCLFRFSPFSCLIDSAARTP